MRKRSVTSRNFLGAFLGGFIGILVSGYLHPIVLPFGVLLGVVVGWWYEEIFASIVESYHQAILVGKKILQTVKKSYDFVADCLKRPAKTFKGVWDYIRTPTAVFVSLAVFASVFIAIMWMLTRPIAFVKWCLAHPMNRARLVRATAFIVYLSLNALWVIPLIIWILPETIRPKANLPPEPTPIVAYLVVSSVALAFAVLPSIEALAESMGEGLRGFYRTYEYYSWQGPIKFFVRELLGMIRWHIMTYLFLIFSVLYFTGAGMLVFVAIIVPLAIFIGFVRGIYKVAIRSGHWLCLGTTMTVTVLSALFFSPYFGNRYMLWSVAFATGIASGIVTEAVRRSIAWLFTNTIRGKEFAAVSAEIYLKNRIVPCGTFILSGWKNLRIESLLP